MIILRTTHITDDILYLVSHIGSTVQKRAYFIFIIIPVIEKLLALQLLTIHVRVNVKHAYSTKNLILIKSI